MTFGYNSEGTIFFLKNFSFIRKYLNLSYHFNNVPDLIQSVFKSLWNNNFLFSHNNIASAMVAFAENLGNESSSSYKLILEKSVGQDECISIL